MLSVALALLACSRRSDTPVPVGDDDDDVVRAPFEPAPIGVYRLTEDEWRNSVQDLVGVRFGGALPGDYRLHGYARVGASEVTVPPLDLELYEAAAWEVARTRLPDPAAVDGFLGCAGTDPACVRGAAARLARRAFRHTPDGETLDALARVHDGLLPEVGEPIASQALLASVLLAPDFLYRTEVGVDDPARPGWRRYTSLELAARLASFLTASLPDEQLLAAAEQGDLDSPAALEAQALRLLDTPRAAVAMNAFFADTIELHELDAVTKDAATYPAFDDALKAEMAAEVEALFDDVVFDRDADFAELLTSSTATVGPALAALYGTGTGDVEVPERGGLLGRAAVASIRSHNVATSPTDRGKFVATRLLCRSVFPPPPGIDTSIVEGSTEGTLRQRMEQHVADPVCATCHDSIDPLGFAMEGLDAIGALRDEDNGLPIDATGDLDGVFFDGVVELGKVVAEHPEFPTCMALQAWRSGSGRAEQLPQLVAIDEIGAGFVAGDRRFHALVVALVTSESFRTAIGPAGEVCGDDEEGLVRPCSTGCGAGEETCADGRWQGCSAPVPADEDCDGVDDDCDGDVDEGPGGRPEKPCEATYGWGTSTCEAGAWSSCEGPGAPPPPDEVCNGVDDDGDTLVDEDQELALVESTPAALAAAQPGCDVLADPGSPDCRAAVHRTCAAPGCAVSGFGPVAGDALVCLDPTLATVSQATFTELSGYHDGCNAGARQGGACNAAISRRCAALGLGTGYGPVENSGDDATTVCTPTATVLDGSYLALAGYDPGCNGSTRWGPACDRAIHAWCVSQGYASGHGPLENNGDLAIVACLPGGAP